MNRAWVKRKWCEATHGGGEISRDDHGRINWQCVKCGRWHDHPVSLEDEQRMTARALAQRFNSLSAGINKSR
jgi:Zn-finger protein